MSQSVSVLLSSRRKALGLTRRELASRAGATEQSLLNWEHRDILPRPHQYASICAAYQITMQELTDAVSRSLAIRGAA